MPAQFQIGQSAGDYRIVEILGSGGAGQVFKVEHRITRRVEAMKVLLSGRMEEQAERFLREIQVQASLQHPHIASVLNAFWVDDDLVMIMELVEGESLEKRLERGRLPLETALDYARQALAALRYAHSRRVAHRDIKPANIIVTPGGAIKLTDFGLAKSAADPRLTQTGAVLGTAHYMSPEQVKSAAVVDARSDIYSLGAVLYEMATGRRPFQAESPFDLMLAQVQTLPRPPVEIDASVPAALSRAILKALAKGPEERFQSAEEFLAALETRPASVVPRKSRDRMLWYGAGAAVMAMAGLASLELRPAPVDPPPVVRAKIEPAPLTMPHAAKEPAKEPAKAPAAPGFHRVHALATRGVAEALAFSPDSRWLAAGTGRPEVEIWDAVTGRLRDSWGGNGSAVTVVAFSPDGSRLATGSRDGIAKVWGMSGRTELNEFRHPGAVASVALSHDNQWLAVGVSNKRVKLWHLTETGRFHEMARHNRAPQALAFSPGGAYLASVSNENVVRLVELPRGPFRQLAGPELGATTLAFSPDQSRLAVGGIDRLRLMEVPSGRVVQSLEVAGLLHLIAFTADGRCLALATTPGAIALWDVEKGHPVASLRSAGTVRALALSPDGRRIAMAADDGGVALWEWQRPLH